MPVAGPTFEKSIYINRKLKESLMAFKEPLEKATVAVLTANVLQECSFPLWVFRFSAIRGFPAISLATKTQPQFKYPDTCIHILNVYKER